MLTKVEQFPPGPSSSSSSSTSSSSFLCSLHQRLQVVSKDGKKKDPTVPEGIAPVPPDAAQDWARHAAVPLVSRCPMADGSMSSRLLALMVTSTPWRERGREREREREREGERGRERES
ncbi:hypothetical protein INR49_009596 [Caranx melampygus]|nr:hypothetical protein INR49_009596 [Caranx melampygus]